MKLPKFIIFITGTLLFGYFFITAQSAQAATGNPNIYYQASENTIYVRNTQDTTPTIVALPDIAAAIADPSLIKEESPGVWLLQANLWIKGKSDDVEQLQLNLTSSTVTWLKLKSTPSGFIWFKSYNANINIQNTKITSWDTGAGNVDTVYSDGRAFVLTKYNAWMDINNSELAYLGYPGGEAYGVSWRIRTGTKGQYYVTGTVTNSKFHHNYYGVYTFGADGMVFRGNEFYQNIQYGFDPHDDSNNFLVENNKAYSNGNHGIIFSRRCNNNIIRNNQSYNNALSGIMLDRDSNNNIVEGNIVYGNVNGIALYGSDNNQIKNNHVYSNQRGILAKDFSTGNTISGNTIEQNTQYGIYFYGGALQNTITANQINNNTKNGVYIKGPNNIIGPDNDIYNNQNGVYLYDSGANYNIIQNNNIHDNTRDGITIKKGDDNQISNNQITDNTKTGIIIRAGDSNRVTDNQILRNGLHGVYIYGGSNYNTIGSNQIKYNQTRGIYIKDSSNTKAMTNAITNNQSSGIYLLRSTFNELESNVLSDNQRGVSIKENSHQNQFLDNTISYNGDYGIYITGYSALNQIKVNQIYGNGKDGLYLSNASRTVIYGNNIYSNNRYGLYFYKMSNSNTVESNLITDHSKGVYIKKSDLTVLKQNEISLNKYAIYVYDSDGSLFETNTLTGNTYNYHYAKYKANFEVIDTIPTSAKVADYASSALITDTDNYVLSNSKNIPTTVNPANSSILLTRSITSSIVSFDRLPLQVTPDSGEIEIKKLDWETSGTYLKKWKETGSSTGIISDHTVGDLQPGHTYRVLVNNVLFGTYLANASGKIQFSYTSGYSNIKYFKVIE